MQLGEALEAEGRRLAEAERSIEALKMAAGADKESTVAALQVCTLVWRGSWADAAFC